MRPKNSYILRFDSRELAESCICYFPVKACHSGYTIIITSASDAEWLIYEQVIRLLKVKKIDVYVSRC